jgi:hypothetical protein
MLLFTRRFLRSNTTLDRNNLRLLRRVQSHARGLARRELDDFLHHADYFHRVKYFWLNAARIRHIDCVFFIEHFQQGAT